MAFEHLLPMGSICRGVLISARAIFFLHIKFSFFWGIEQSSLDIAEPHFLQVISLDLIRYDLVDLSCKYALIELSPIGLSWCLMHDIFRRRTLLIFFAALPSRWKFLNFLFLGCVDVLIAIICKSKLVNLAIGNLLNHSLMLVGILWCSKDISEGVAVLVFR